MGQIMKFFTAQKSRKLLRSLHRDIGYLFVGLSCIYAFSGILLNVKEEKKNPAYREIFIKDNFQSDLTPIEVKESWGGNYTDGPLLNRIIPHNNLFRLYFKGGIGEYNPENGNITCTIFEERKIIKIINNIHYNQGKRFTWIGNLFASSLIFLAISGAIIVKGKKGFKRRGGWLILVGLVFPIVWYFLTL